MASWGECAGGRWERTRHTCKLPYLPTHVTGHGFGHFDLVRNVPIDEADEGVERGML